MATLTAKNEENSGFGKMLGIKAAGPMQLIKSIQDGLPFQALERIRKEMGLPMESLAGSIGISSRTLTRRKKEKKLNSFESDRLVSISRLVSMSIQLFEGDKAKAFEWFSKSNRALGGISPLEMASTETGAREVENLIGRLEHGVFT